MNEASSTVGVKADDPRRRLASKVVAQANRFDLPCLISLLREKFPDFSITFRGHPSLACEPSLVHQVVFGSKQVEVILNLGLVSSTSPLASYFLRARGDPHVGSGLEQLLELCDASLLARRADTHGAAFTPACLKCADGLRRTVWQLHRPLSPMSIQWCMRQVFPELEIEVVRMQAERSFEASIARTGWSTIGAAALGARTTVGVPGVEVRLATDDSHCWSGTPWHSEIIRRLNDLSPPAAVTLGAVSMIVLFDRQCARQVVLQRSELGFVALGKARPPLACRIASQG